MFSKLFDKFIANDPLVEKTQNGIHELIKSSRFGEQTNAVFLVGSKLITNLYPSSDSQHLVRYNEIIAATIVVALAREDSKYGIQQQYQEYLYKPFRLDQLWDMFFENHPSENLKVSKLSNEEYCDYLQKLIVYLGSIILKKPEIYKNTISIKFLSSLTDVLPDNLKNKLFYSFDVPCDRLTVSTICPPQP